LDHFSDTQETASPIGINTSIENILYDPGVGGIADKSQVFGVDKIFADVLVIGIQQGYVRSDQTHT
jgi:hypothetical protein